MIEFIPYKNLFLIQINKRYRVIDSWKLNNFSGAKHLLSYAISFSPPPPLFLLLFFFYYLRVCSSFSPLESGWLNTAPYRSAHLNDKHNDKPCGDKRNPVILTGEHRKKKKRNRVNTNFPSRYPHLCPTKCALLLLETLIIL